MPINSFIQPNTSQRVRHNLSGHSDVDIKTGNLSSLSLESYEISELQVKCLAIFISPLTI